MKSASRRASAAAIAAAVWATGGVAHGDTWTNGGGDALWSNPLNWQDGSVPTENDDVTFGGAVVGSSSITVPSGAVANGLTFSHAYTLNGGTLALGKPTVTQGFLGVNFSVLATINTQLIGAKGLIINPTQTLVLNGNNTFTGPVNVNGGVASGTNAVRIQSDAALGDLSNVCAMNGTVEADATFTSMRTYTLGTSGAGFSVTSGKTLTIGTSLNEGGVLKKFGAGTLVLAAPCLNTINGGVDMTVRLGTLRVENPTALGAGTVGVRVQELSTFEIGSVTWARGVELQAGTLRASGNAVVTGIVNLNLSSFSGNKLNGGLNASDSLTIGDGANDLTGGGSAPLTVEGLGRVILPYSSNANVAWNVNGGKLVVKNSSALGTNAASVTLGSGGALSVGGAVMSRSVTVGSGGGMFGSAGAAGEISGNVSVQGTAPLTFALTGPGETTSADLTMSGALTTSGSMTVTNSAAGPAAMILTNPSNTLFGTSVLTVGANAEVISKPANKTGYTLAKGPVVLRGGKVSFYCNADTTMFGSIAAGITGAPPPPAGPPSYLFFDRYDAGGSARTLKTGLTIAQGEAMHMGAGHDYTINVTPLSNQGGEIIHDQGKLLISGTQNYSAGSKLTVAGGSVEMTANANSANLTIDANAGSTLLSTTQRVGAVNIASGATVELAANGGRVLHTNSLSAAGRLDLNDNDLVINGGVFSNILSLVNSGYSATPDTSRTGIVSTTGQNSNGTTILALFDNTLLGGSVTEWPAGSGQTVAANAVIGKYTYFGDVDFNGKVTGDDYLAFDANLGTAPAPGLAWLAGDMNFDGTVTGDDYLVCDANLGSGVGNPLGASGASVPEPAAAGLILGLRIICGRRRKYP